MRVDIEGRIAEEHADCELCRGRGEFVAVAPALARAVFGDSERTGGGLVIHRSPFAPSGSVYVVTCPGAGNVPSQW